MTWIIERFSVLEIEDGTKVALKAPLDTAIAASADYFVAGLQIVRTYLYIFPVMSMLRLSTKGSGGRANLQPGIKCPARP